MLVVGGTRNQLKSLPHQTWGVRMRLITLITLLFLLFSTSSCALLGLEEEEDSSTPTPTSSTVTTVTLRAYTLNDNYTSPYQPITNSEKQAGTFEQINDATISSRGWKMTDTGKTYSVDVGVPCDSWERTETGHGAQGNLEANYNSHSHYNAADNTSYVNGIYSWTEFGPEHTQANIDTTCSIGTGGVNKTANSDNYTADVNIYLKIDSVTTR